MYSFELHYDNILAKYYSVVYGGRKANYAKFLMLMKEFNINAGNGDYAVDLGSGNGFCSIPLAEMGFKVTAIDLSKVLLEEIKMNKGQLQIDLFNDDILKFDSLINNRQVDLIICMTDVISHLNSYEEISYLLGKVSESLVKNGKFILSYRDQTNNLEGTSRFIPFYSSDNLILTTFIELHDKYIDVTDIFNIKENSGWLMVPGTYRKLRLFNENVKNIIEGSGLKIIDEKSERGMTYLSCGHRQ